VQRPINLLTAKEKSKVSITGSSSIVEVDVTDSDSAAVTVLDNIKLTG